MTERFEVFVEGYHWMMAGCLLSLTLYFSEMQSSDFFGNKRKNYSQKAGNSESFFFLL